MGIEYLRGHRTHLSKRLRASSAGNRKLLIDVVGTANLDHADPDPRPNPHPPSPHHHHHHPHPHPHHYSYFEFSIVLR